MNVYPFIEAENAAGNGNVQRACELLKVSRAAYYAQRAAGLSQRRLRDAELTVKIVEIHDDSNRTYGSPRVHHELRAAGERCSRKRVARLMRAADRYGRTPETVEEDHCPRPGRCDPSGPGRPRLHRGPRPAGRTGCPLVW